MTFAEVDYLFEHSPALHLLRRRDHAPLIIGFLFSTFKVESVGGPRPLVHVVEQLAAYLEQRQAEKTKLSGEKSAEAWLREWAGEDARLIRIWHDEDSRELMVELTADAERVLTWLEGFLRREHVGVESKIREIHRDIEGLLDTATDNPDIRLERLEKQIDALQREAKAIRSGEGMQIAAPRVLNENFARLQAKVRELPGDFREVEDRLRRIAREIGERALQPEASRGELVAFALDAHKSLQESPQGQSVDGFLDFIRPPDLQDEVIRMVDLLYDMRDLAPELRADGTLRNMFSLLAREAVRVQRSRQRLVGVLRAVLDRRRRSEARSVTEAVQECQQLFHRHARALYESDFEFNLADAPGINPLMSRSLWQEPAGAMLGAMADVADMRDPAALEALVRMASIDLEQLTRNVRDLLQRRSFATLTDVIAEYPLQFGVIELLGYLLLAVTQQVPALVEETEFDVIEVATESGARHVRCPRVVFAQ